MEKHNNHYLANVLKQWVGQYHPPADGRQRLLQKAAHPQNQASNKLALSWLIGQETLRPDIFGIDLHRKLTGWLCLPGNGNLSVA